MKQLLAVLLCLLLCGCAEQASPVLSETLPENTEIPVMTGLYDPSHPMEQAYPGLVRAYPLPLENVRGILPLGKDVLVLSGQERTTMTVFTGEELLEAASLTLDFSLQQEDSSLQIHENGISFYDPNRGATLVLDNRLRETRRIAAAQGLSGKPVLSSDGNTLYYCTDWSVTAWDLGSGIRKTLKELAYDSQELTALHLDGQLLECTIQDNGITSRLLLTADQGLEVRVLPEDAALHTEDTRYFAVLPSGYLKLMVFGTDVDGPELLLPQESWDRVFYLPEDHAAVTASSSESRVLLNYYELNTGILRASLTLDTPEIPGSMINGKGHSTYILAYDPASDCDILYRWDVLRQTPDPKNITICKTDYHSADHPDTESLEACREYAKTIGEKYGITVRIWEDAAAVQPWDYQFQPEYLAPVLEKELRLLDQRLATYPETLLQQTKDHFADLTICLVRQITGTGNDRSLSTATGIQFFSENKAYVAITTGKYSEQALYHELYHVMETHILTESSGLDLWESLNPAGFTYGSSQENPDIYLQGQTRAFVDRYSMYYLKEDRARILENAILPGKQDLFRSEYMQRKLTAMCSAIREAYGLKKHPEVLPWEQYLINPLTPKP